MATLDLDPVFVKALKLLHSKNKDSAEQLKQMLDDIIAQRKGLQRSSSSSGEKSSSSKSSSGKNEEEPVKKREPEKRHLDKLKQDISDLSQENPAKKSRTESPQPEKDSATKSSSKDRDKEKDREREKEREKAQKDKDQKEKHKKEMERKEKLEKEKEREREKEREKERERKKEEERKQADESTDEEKSMDADDFAFGLGISCVVCRQFDVTSVNQLVECQECHNLYHQECHRPPVTEQDVNDPRFVWYCYRCAKTMKKMVAKPLKPKPVPTAPAKETSPTIKITKPEPSTLLPFRRMEPKISTTKEVPGSAGGKPLSGLASLAANLAGRGLIDQSKVSSKLDQSKSVFLSKSDSSEKTSSAVSLLKSGASLGPVPLSKSSKPPSEPSKSGTAAKPSSLQTSTSSKLSSGGGTNAAASADKRLQLMKKKAAAKSYEKRTHIK